jgi:hypothetical protein
LVAYNYGRGLRLAPGPGSWLLAALGDFSPQDLNLDETQALARIGPAEFRKWALRGWGEASQPEARA